MNLNSTWRLFRLVLAGTLTCFLFGCSSGPKGDPVHGKELYAMTCAGCHKLQENSTGPMHCGLFGRPAGTVPGFAYSEAMKASGIVWDAQRLDEFLTSPIAYVVGTNMGFVGFPDPADRADIIAYLKQATSDPAICPQS